MVFRAGRMRLFLAGLAIATVFVALLAACGGGTATQGQAASVQAIAGAGLGPGERLQVVATTNIVADVVGEVAGSHVDLTALMGIGVDPHSYVATPSDIAAVHDADVVFSNGAGLEEFLDEMMRNAGGQAVQVPLSDSLALLEMSGDEADHHGTDPHVWFDVQNVMQWVDTVSGTLSTLDPANAADYRANAEMYTVELRALDAWIATEVARIPGRNRKLVTNHPALGYLAARYGLEQVGTVYPVSPSSEPSARDIAALVDAIRSYGVPAVFTESTVNARLADQVAQETGVTVVSLYTGSLGPAGSGAESYVDMMRYDVTAIVDALQ
jgi:manganese/iron transport system substrate-binding protein